MAAYYGVRTRNSWYLLEEEKSPLAPSAWHLFLEGKRFRIGVLVHQHLVDLAQGRDTLYLELQKMVESPAQTFAAFGRGKSVTPACQISSIDDFLCHAVFCTSEAVSQPSDLREFHRKVVCNTSPVAETIAFR